MVCYHPTTACFSKSYFKKTGKKNVTPVLTETYKNGQVVKDSKWQLNEKYHPHALYEYITIPCKKCVGCRSDNAKMWFVRAVNESRMHEHKCFITLTYDDNSEVIFKEPKSAFSLNYKHFQLFMKKLRKRFPEKEISYLVCGEYGLENGRAHWHAILYGIDFSEDREVVYVDKGYEHYSSKVLEECWSTYNREFGIYTPIGFVDLANVDDDCCAYVSQYVLKKLPVEDNPFDYDRTPPMIRSSRNPAIGLRWYEKYGKDSIDKGFVYITNKDHTRTRKYKTPEYYYKKFEISDPETFEIIKKRKEEFAREKMRKNPIDRVELQRQEDSHFYRIKQTIKKVLTKFIK